MQGCTSQQCRSEECQPSSSRPPDALTISNLVRIGQDLIRWKLLTFYSPFFSTDKAADVRVKINTCAAAIRAELKRVDVVKTWRQYEDENARDQPGCKPRVDLEMQVYQTGALERLKDNLLRRARVRIVKPSVQITVQVDDDAAVYSEQPNGHLRGVFAEAARKLGVSRKQLETSMQMYAKYMEHEMERERERSSSSSKPKQNQWTAESMARDGNWSILARILLEDVQDLAPSLTEGLSRSRAGVTVPSTPDVLNSETGARANGKTCGCPARANQTAPSFSPSSSLSSSTARTAAKDFMVEGAELRDILSAIWECKKNYFNTLQFDGPNGRYCLCGTDEYCRRCGPFTVKVQVRASTALREVWARFGNARKSRAKAKEKEKQQQEEYFLDVGLGLEKNKAKTGAKSKSKTAERGYSVDVGVRLGAGKADRSGHGRGREAPRGAGTEPKHNGSLRRKIKFTLNTGKGGTKMNHVL
ncbi:hypothetical protein A1O3_10408 [Capronia epimyces CBS 606.96]|uniref:Uncharacterized protein n=1 Tax=Capronia epimyces CBS 606.96 TaxID=1182542 RepID=W9XIR4_9EURO|nr:uncharacterized protein A1O3_10408 [Capronia epimyces CBS 606.96]EXJ77250.1 hypothetical protein A1O3_10408 [Capronia epimyces CBS 606.96]